MDNWSNSKKSGYYLYSRILLAGFIVSLSFGCATRHTLEDVAGERAEYKFRALDSDMPHPMIHWVEKPRHIETAIRLDPQLGDCKKVRIFVNHYPDSPRKLSEDQVGLVPLDLSSRDEEMESWKDIPIKECALLITLGSIREDLFTGVSVSTLNGVIHRHRTVLQGRLKGRPSQLGWLMFSNIYDYTHSPIYVLGGAAGLKSGGPTQPVTVIFELPNNELLQTVIKRSEVTDLLGTYYPNVLSVPMYPLEHIRAWTRAAIAKLKLEFVEEATGDLAHDEWIPDSLSLKMVNGYWGNWRYTVNSHGAYNTNLANSIGDSNLIRFSLPE
jgi:hypothetical protein